MLTYNDCRVPDSTYEISLNRLIGKPAVDVRGYLVKEWGEPSFKITHIELADGTLLHVGGEHDLPYLEDLEKQPNGDMETLERLYAEANE